MAFTWTHQRFKALSGMALFKILQARQAVFVVEQNCAFTEIDDTDLTALHLTAWDHAGDVAGYARIIDPGVCYSEASIGRILTTQKHRGTGLGREVVKKSIEIVNSELGSQSIKIGAQQRLEKFYNSMGFVSSSSTYWEDGILHVEMLRPADETKDGCDEAR